MEKKRTFKRDELYEVVWSTPITKLAQDFGISDRGLSKICERHHIPVPGRGHWARVEAGLPTTKTPLWKLNNPAIETVYINGSPSKVQSPYLSEILRAAKADKQAEELDPSPGLAPPVQPAAPVFEPPKKMYPEVFAVVGELQKVPTDRDGFVYFKYIKIPPSAIDRLGKLLNRILAKLHPYGFVLIEESNRMGFAKDGCAVHMHITAPRKRVTKPSYSGSYLLHEHQHVGRLEFRIYGPAEGTRKNWTDTDARKIEDAIDQIVDSFLINHAVAKEEAEKRRENEARRAHLARRRELAVLRAKREEDRLEFLRWIAEARREAADLRATIDLVPKDTDLPADYRRMIVWAESRLSELEALTAVERLQQAIQQKKLFHDPDELLDPEGDPPPKKNHWDD